MTNKYPLIGLGYFDTKNEKEEALKLFELIGKTVKNYIENED